MRGRRNSELGRAGGLGENPPNMSQTAILWIYIVLLFLGGLMGFLKAGSKISLIMSAAFAGILILCNTDLIFKRNVADMLATVVLVFLLVFFSVRLV